MSNATTLQTNNNKLSANNTDLASILNTINNLPEAGGGSGGSVETCTITMKHYPLYSESYAIKKVVYQTLDDSGNIILKEITNSNGGISYSTNEFTLSDVVFPSIMYAIATGTNQVLTGCTKITGSYGECVAQINGTGSIEFQPTG